MGTQNSLLYDFAGLVTAPGRLARNTASATTADNVFFPAPGLMTKRTGWARYANATNRTPGKVWGFSGGIPMMEACGTSAGLVQLGLCDGSSPFQSLTTPDNAPVASSWANRSQATQCARSVYVTRPGGGGSQPVRIGPEAWNAIGPWYGKMHYAGMPRGLPCNFNLFAGTVLTDKYGAAYRVTWHRYDGDGKLLSGPPTSRTVVRNVVGAPGGGGGSPLNPTLTIYLPKQWATGFYPSASPVDVDTTFFWRLWRTRTFDTTTTDSDEEYFLVAEAFVTSAQITGGSLSYVDSTPDDYLSVPLNINTINLQGIEVDVPNPGLANSDEPPPLAYDVASWANSVWWGNIRYNANAQVSFLSIGAPNGLQDGDTITLGTSAGTLVLTARTAPASSTEFKIYTAYTTAEWNLEATAWDFARVANLALRTAGSAVRVHTLLPDSGAPVGTVWIEPIYSFASSRTTWYRYSPSDSLAQVGELTNAVAFSKPDRADAVPLVSVIRCGPNDAEVQRMVPYRDRLLVFTTRGVYQITGSSFADFAVTPYALDLHLLAREAVCACEDAVYAWCREGLVRLADTGWTVISTPIEPSVQTAVQDASGVGWGVAELAFCIPDTQRHRVWFWYPNAVLSSPQCAAAFVYDTRTQALSTASFENRDGLQTMWLTTGCQRLTDFRIIGASAKYETETEGWLYVENLPTDASTYTDAGASSVINLSSPVTSALALQWQIPDAAGAQHWQQTVLQLDGEEFGWRPLASQLEAEWLNVDGDASTVSAVPVTVRVVRLEPPVALRRGNQLQVVLRNHIAEYFGVVGITQRFRSGSTFARQVEP